MTTESGAQKHRPRCMPCMSVVEIELSKAKTADEQAFSLDPSGETPIFCALIDEWVVTPLCETVDEDCLRVTRVRQATQVAIHGYEGVYDPEYGPPIEEIQGQYDS